MARNSLFCIPSSLAHQAAPLDVDVSSFAGVTLNYQLMVPSTAKHVFTAFPFPYQLLHPEDPFALPTVGGDLGYAR